MILSRSIHALRFLETVPFGEVRVAIQQALPSVKPRPEPNGKGTAGSGGQEFVPGVLSENLLRLPENDGHPDQSGLEFELNHAEHDWSVDLK